MQVGGAEGWGNMRADGQCDEGDEGAPNGEVVYGDEWVGAVPDPAEGGVDAGGAGDTEEGDGDGAEALGGGGGGKVVTVICRSGDVGSARR